jgi:hypothetical protein
MSLPDKILIRWMPDLHTAHVGCFRDSEQFFLARHSLPSREYVALYCFDRAGVLTSHKIVQPIHLTIGETVTTLLAEPGPHYFKDICVLPFQVTFEDRTFGLIPDSQLRSITLEPGSMITFMEPWDGEYYT